MVLNEQQKIYVQNEFVKRHDRESGKRTIYLDEKSSLEIWIERGVLGSDLMKPAISLAGFLHTHPELYRNRKVLDMGCGAGAQGIICAMNGAEYVAFSDIISKAVDNCRRNLEEFGISNSGVYEGDLFEPLPKNKYGLIIFNNPFFPEGAEHFEGYHLNDLPWQGLLGGIKLLRSFYSKSKEYLEEGGMIIQPYLHLAGEENNPANRAPEYGFKVEEHNIISEDEPRIGKQSIYILSRID